MIGSSVVPGLPNRWVMPSSLSSARNAERPVMRFFMSPPSRCRYPRDFVIMIKLVGPAQWSAVMAALHHRARLRTRSKYPLMIEALLLFRALPDHAGKTLQRHQGLAGIGPLLQFPDRDVIERLAAGAARKKRARDVHHVRRTGAFVKQRRAAVCAEAARGFRGFVLEARDGGLAPGDAQALAPASDIGRVGRAMGTPARGRMIVPGPARGHINLEGDF